MEFSRAGGELLFESDEVGGVPDIIWIVKAMTGGYVTIGAALAAEEVVEGLSSVPPPVAGEWDRWVGYHTELE